MLITVLFFAGLRDRVGVPKISVEVANGATVSDAIEAARVASEREWAVPKAIMTAVNEEYADRDQRLSDGDELALIPPVSGGIESGKADFVLITDEPLDSEAVSAHVRAAGDGAVVIFEGVTRNINDGRGVEYLEYEAYRPMAERVLRGLASEAADRFAVALCEQMTANLLANVVEGRIRVGVDLSCRPALRKFCRVK